MTNPPPVTKGSGWQSTDLVILARVRSIDGAYLKQASVQSISISSYDMNESVIEGTPTLVWGPTALSVSSVVFDSMQPYDGIFWTVDRTGYNFKYRVSGALAFPRAADYRLIVMVTLTDGTTFPMRWDIPTTAVP